MSTEPTKPEPLALKLSFDESCLLRVAEAAGCDATHIHILEGFTHVALEKWFAVRREHAASANGAKGEVSQ